MLTDKKRPYYSPEVWGGIECTINRVGDAWFDQLQYAGVYQNPNLEVLTDLGIKKNPLSHAFGKSISLILQHLLTGRGRSSS